MVLSKKRITKALIRLRACEGWSAPVLFANLRRQVFSRRGPFIGRWLGVMLSTSESAFREMYRSYLAGWQDKIVSFEANLGCGWDI